jgi:hypothetical protein
LSDPGVNVKYMFEIKELVTVEPSDWIRYSDEHTAA